MTRTQCGCEPRVRRALKSHLNKRARLAPRMQGPLAQRLPAAGCPAAAGSAHLQRALKLKCTCTHIFQGVTYVQGCMTHTVPSVQNQGVAINKDHTLKRLWLRVTRKMMNDGAKMTRKRKAEASG